MDRRNAVTRIRGLVVASSLALGSAAFGQVTLDGDLSDIIAVAQGQQADPPNDVCPVGRSGFDLTHVYVYYDCSADALYVGLDVMDVPPGLGHPGPGVPGDADGDGNPDTFTDMVLCVAPPFLEEPGVGVDELYVVLVDTNSNGSTRDPEDLWVEFRNDELHVLDGTRAPIPGATAAIQLGTAGCPVDTSIPDEFENRNTTDIELRIDHYSQLDPSPEVFNVSVLSGAFFSGVPLDSVTSVFVDLENTLLAGNVDRHGPFGGAASVLRVNGTAGSCFDRRVSLALGAGITLSLDPSPAGPPEARYVVWLWRHAPGSGTPLVAHGEDLGLTALPTPFSPGLLPQPFACLRSPGATPGGCAHVPEIPSPQFAPWTASRAQGISQPMTVTAQGVIEDSGAANLAGLSVTNAVVLRIE
jgi:hypothetical protein